MNRLSLIALAACLAAGLVPASASSPAQAQTSSTAPSGQPPAGRRIAVEEPLPIPPIPPAEVASNYEAAPTPGQIGAAPGAAQGPRGPELSPTLMTPKQFYQGEGFLAGSTVQSEQQRKAKPAAGFNLTVPLQ